MGKILSIGLDVSLLFHRKLTLQQTGATVVSARVEPALAMLEGEFFDVIILCYTLSERDLHALCRTIELFWPVSRVLRLEEENEGLTAFDGLESSAQAGAASRALVELTRSLLQDAHIQRSHPPFVFPLARSVRKPALLRPHGT